MKRFLLLGFCSALLAPAQTFSLAASGDGAILQFATNLYLKGEPVVFTPSLPPPSFMRIYRYADPPLIERTVEPRGTITAPFISTDGDTLGAFSYLPCFGSCMFAFPRALLTVQRNGRTQVFSGNTFRVSRNGRFVFESGFFGFRTLPTLRDLDTDRTYEFGKTLDSYAQSLADDGSTLAGEAGQLTLWRLGQAPQVLLKSGTVLSAAITAHANFAFVLEQTERYRLLEIDLATRQTRELWQGDAKPVGLSVDASGRRVILQNPNQLLLWDRSAGWRSLFSHDAGIASVLLTDNGEVAYATTSRNALYRIDAGTGEAQQLYAPFPLRMSQQSLGAYPGSLLRMTMDYPEPRWQFRVRGQAFPVVKAEDRIFDVQIPWEFTDSKGRTETAELTSDDSPFSLRENIFFADDFAGPWAFTSGPNLVAAQADFAALITRQNPATPGALIHFWVTGLGPLDRPVATGEKGPAEPPAVPLNRVACYIVGQNASPPARGLRVPAVIYAPGMVGVYQIDAEIPADWPAGTAYLFCQSPQLGGSGGELPIGPPR